MKDFYKLVWDKLIEEHSDTNKVWDQVNEVASYLDNFRSGKSLIVKIPNWNAFQDELFILMRQVVFEQKQYMQWQVIVTWLQAAEDFNYYRINKYRQEIFDAIDKRSSDTHEGKEFLKVSGY